jgi:poly(A) polymerase
MIRVIRHAARTGFSIEGKTFRAISRNREEIRKCSPSRVRDEFLRDLKEGKAEASLNLMLQTGLLLSIFPDLERVFGDRNPLNIKNRKLFLRLYSLVDQMCEIGKPVSESILISCLMTPFLRAVTPEHLFLRERERAIYLTQAIRWAVLQLLNPFSFPKGTKEMVSQILIAQSYLKKALRRGVIPKRLRMKKYFPEAVLFFGLEARVRDDRVPFLLRRAVPPGLLP